MSFLKRAFVLAAFSAVAAVALSACNTIEGVGQDTQSVGKAVEDTADGAKPSNH
jgi:predicted small secreted protein